MWKDQLTMTKTDAVAIECNNHEQSPKRWSELVQTAEHFAPPCESPVYLPYSPISRTKVPFLMIHVDKYYADHAQSKPHPDTLK